MHQYSILTIADIWSFITQPLPYEQGLVYYITPDLLQVRATAAHEVIEMADSTIKIEGMERYNQDVWDLCQRYAILYNHRGPITCHAFMAAAGSVSFGVHTDPDTVVVHCCDGIKIMEVNGVEHILTPGSHVYMPYNTPHRAINRHASLMLSIGLERFYTDKL